MVDPVRVLVVDDTEQIRMLIRLNLELEGHVVEEAADGDACLQRLRDPSLPRPDVVTMDAVMEPRDGWTTLADIRRDPALATLPVVMVTASVQAHQRARARDAGIDALVSKPFDPSALVEVVEDLAASGRPAQGAR
ncbi:response regulator [Quadrisphaera sp. DSM 44207]|uniref:response regulator n=1 Tax=Quadrisphaera sp. DSM 44207 TaxID=1881057 RepID=UPI00088D0F3C|nr:response regulator [Quadrisphaera sp. DSM 44207]SDQ07681.1 Response regulator receiver domain-containing protein [Quadrisphaera sp. DSM 44207]